MRHIFVILLLNYLALSVAAQNVDWLRSGIAINIGVQVGPFRYENSRRWLAGSRTFDSDYERINTFSLSLSNGLEIGGSDLKSIGSPTSQRQGFVRLGRFMYENDGGVPGIINSKGQYDWSKDRWRTASARLKLSSNTYIGLNLGTGEPEPWSSIDPNYNENYQYIGSADDYRLGALYLGVGDMRFGVNSEWVRDVFQNQFVHQWLFSRPWFPVNYGPEGLQTFRPMPNEYPNEFYFQCGGNLNGTAW